MTKVVPACATGAQGVGARGLPPAAPAQPREDEHEKADTELAGGGFPWR
jgi:hypothetical protein